jgi:hypothetical protein
MDIISIALLILVFVVLSAVFGDNTQPTDNRVRNW